ncbi:MAG1210 family protein [Acholeplasma laidlawii]|uniref:MAG1210 family protein n=1 Tax=Acholeplasma laidlawii TaxID=2148 RepID=UPI00084C36D5|nr:APC family permease [Acholeplasma laidlawii]OED59500.1 hypothetical protein BHS12_03200 [Acholeplasma laidlawii]
MTHTNDSDYMSLHQPLDSYKAIYKDLHNKHVNDKLDSLVLESKIDIQANKSTVKDIRLNEKNRDNLAKTIRNNRSLRSFLIFLIVVLVGVIIYAIYQLTLAPNTLSYILIPTSILLSILFIFLISKKINPKIRILVKDKEAIIKKLEGLFKEAWTQMQPLNDLFYEGMSQELFQKTVPLIKMDQMFDSKRLDYLVNKFGLDDLNVLDRSTLYVQSGEIKGNPFYIAEDLVHKMGTKTYSGSITITYTSTSRVNGRTITTTHTQVLTASVNKPYPLYTEQSYLVYGNEAAPDLMFSRIDSDAEHMSEKQIDKHVNKTIKKLEKKSRKSVNQGTNYTVFGNSEFEVLFGATNRNHEVQFRLLFTPLAQTELLKLMKETTLGFGDDFDFIKHKKINIIVPEHLATIKLDMSPSYYTSYDFEDIKKKFVDYQNAYFRHIYFAFAPVLAIPLYQQTVTQEYLYKDLYSSYVSFFEHEHVVNSMDINKFRHEESATRNILKTKVVRSSDHKDVVQVTAYGYKSVPRVDYVSRLGRDGRTHVIPIPWNEYIPVDKQTNVEINVTPEDKPLTPRQRVEEMVERLRTNNMTPKDMFIIKNFAARVLNPEKNDKIKTNERK